MRHTLSIIGVLLIFSCSRHNQEEIQQLRFDFQKLRKDNDSLSSVLDSLKLNFIEPFVRYEQILMNEKEMSPDSIIQQYEQLINAFPNSFWNHEAKKRINNIDKRRELWHGGEWHLKERDINIQLGVISCPGC